MSNDWRTWGDVYDSYLDELSEGSSCPVCSSYPASRVLKEMDPIAYQCGFADWTDTLAETEYPCTECGTLTSVDSDVCADDEFAPVCEDCAEPDEEDETPVSLLCDPAYHPRSRK